MSNYILERKNTDGTVNLSISSHPFDNEQQSSRYFETDEQAARYLLRRIKTNRRVRASVYEQLSARATVEGWSYTCVVTHVTNNAVFLDRIGYLSPTMTEMTLQRFDSELQSAQYCAEQIKQGAMVYEEDEKRIKDILGR